MGHAYVQVTLEVDVRLLSRLQPSEQDYWVDTLASIRLHVMGAPLRWVAVQWASAAPQHAVFGVRVQQLLQSCFDCNAKLEW